MSALKRAAVIAANILMTQLTRVLRPVSLQRERARGRSIPKAAVGLIVIGGTRSAADHVRSQGHRVKGLDVDLLCDLDRIIDLDAEIPRRALDLGVP